MASLKIQAWQPLIAELTGLSQVFYFSSIVNWKSKVFKLLSVSS